MTSDFWPWWVGGGAVALVATLYPLATTRTLGVSGLYDHVVERVKARRGTPEPAALTLAEALAAATKKEFGVDVELSDDARTKLDSVAKSQDGTWLFLVGIVLGSVLSRLSLGSMGEVWTLGTEFTARYGDSHLFLVVLLVVAGVLIGFGTRMAGGCTSGHGITGVAMFQKGSMLATATFWGVALGVTWIIATLMGRV